MGVGQERCNDYAGFEWPVCHHRRYYHILVERDCDCHGVRASLERLLEERFDLRHTTLQVEHEAPDELLEIQPQTDGRR